MCELDQCFSLRRDSQDGPTPRTPWTSSFPARPRLAPGQGWCVPTGEACAGGPSVESAPGGTRSGRGWSPAWHPGCRVSPCGPPARSQSRQQLTGCQGLGCSAQRHLPGDPKPGLVMGINPGLGSGGGATFLCPGVWGRGGPPGSAGQGGRAGRGGASSLHLLRLYREEQPRAHGLAQEKCTLCFFVLFCF